MRHPRRRLDHRTKADNVFVTVLDPKRDRCGGEVRVRAARRRSGGDVSEGGGALAQRGQYGHDRMFERLQLIHQVRELGIDEPTKLLAAARRAREYIPTRSQEPGSTNLWRRPRPTELREHILHTLRTQEMGTDRDGGQPQSLVAHRQLVRHEDVPPVGVDDLRPIARLVQRRRPRSQDRMIRQRRRLHNSGHPRQIARSGAAVHPTR